ncbi:unnamed protein product [Arabis nemorensis]|uniref:Uncharacterized protein n=1 Tax=Arabis nemorensis TaxID=586526 RepID=A0A565CA37_9BRAS|nr:unnamed protein product [Arabis nemorensis]
MRFSFNSEDVRKAWNRSIEEEVERLTTEVDEHTKRIRDMANHEFLIRQMRLELKNQDEEIAKLKEDLARFDKI